MLNKGTDTGRSITVTRGRHAGTRGAIVTPKPTMAGAVQRYASHMRLLPDSVIVDGNSRVAHYPCPTPTEVFDNVSGISGQVSITSDHALTITTQVYNFTRKRVWVVDKTNIPMPVPDSMYALKNDSCVRGNVVIRNSYSLPIRAKNDGLDEFEKVLETINNGTVYKIYDEFENEIFTRTPTELSRWALQNPVMPELTPVDRAYLSGVASGATLRKMENCTESDQYALTKAYLRRKNELAGGTRFVFHVDYLVPAEDLLRTEIFFHTPTSLILLGNEESYGSWMSNEGGVPHPGSYLAKLLGVRYKHWDFLLELNQLAPVPKSLPEDQRNKTLITGISVVWHEEVTMYYSQNGCVFKITTSQAIEGKGIGVHFYNDAASMVRDDDPRNNSELIKNFYSHRPIQKLTDLEKYGIFTTASAAFNNDYVKVLQHEVAVQKAEQELRRSEQENMKITNSMELENKRHIVEQVKANTAHVVSETTLSKNEHEKEILPIKNRHEINSETLKNVGLALAALVTVIKFSIDIWKTIKKT
jgi:hypothetical protein